MTGFFHPWKMEVFIPRPSTFPAPQDSHTKCSGIASHLFQLFQFCMELLDLIGQPILSLQSLHWEEKGWWKREWMSRIETMGMNNLARVFSRTWSLASFWGLGWCDTGMHDWSPVSFLWVYIQPWRKTANWIKIAGLIFPLYFCSSENSFLKKSRIPDCTRLSSSTPQQIASALDHLNFIYSLTSVRFYPFFRSEKNPQGSLSFLNVRLQSATY